jgi:hypothetical protein
VRFAEMISARGFKGSCAKQLMIRAGTLETVKSMVPQGQILGRAETCATERSIHETFRGLAQKS